jgi:hypothetical protein
VHRRVQAVEGWLGGGGEDDAGAVGCGEVGQGAQGGHGELRRQTLGLVEQDDGLHQGVQLPAARWAVGEQGFEQLDVGGQYDGRIPVLGQQATLALLAALGVAPLGLVAQPRQAVVLQDEVPMEAGEDIAVDACGLFDDGEEGDRQDDAPELVAHGVLQGEAQHGQRLAGTGGSGEGEEPW